MELPVLQAVHPEDFKQYCTETIRQRFLMEALVKDDTINFVYSHYERMITGLAKPVTKALTLDTYENLRAETFLERREMGIINVGGDGTVTADGEKYSLQKLDCVYVGKGVKEVSFESVAGDNPAIFFLLSTPAHQSHPTAKMESKDATPIQLGSSETANNRTIYKYIHIDGIKSCQLVMGLTVMHPGSVWNTMPPHVHDRRSEVYFYFDVPEGHAVFHYMGEPQQTRHMVVKNHQAIVSPPWSIHSGSGTASYSFIWAMGGENLVFTDMDPAPITSLL
ncbi:MAG: 5-dehydro-4-deoxy-D-glucuronate isomerase [Bacteroidota bacterium]